MANRTVGQAILSPAGAAAAACIGPRAANASATQIPCAIGATQNGVTHNQVTNG